MAEPGTHGLSIELLLVGFGAFAFKVESPRGRAIPHAGEVVGDNAQSRQSFEVGGPLPRLIAIHGAEKPVAVRSLQRVFYLVGELLRARGRPAGRHPRVYQNIVALLVEE